MSEQDQPETPQQPKVQNHYQALLPSEKYAIVVNHMKHEHELSNARMKWLLTFQGFLFASIAVYENGKPHFLPSGFFQRVVPFIGTVSALAVFLGIIASRMARKKLKALWKSSGVIGFPELSPSPAGAVLGAIPGLAVPIILVLAWLFLLVSPLPNSAQIASQTSSVTVITQMPAPISGTNVNVP